MAMGMSMGMYQVQSLQLLQTMAMTMTMGAGGFRDDPFRTDGERVDVSQKEILDNLTAIIEKGEFFDHYHFGLEINRQIFGHPLENNLGEFGRDISDLVRFYQSDDQSAKRILTALKGEDDMPGKLANTWRQIRESKDFDNEADEQKVLNFISSLQTTSADMASALDILQKSTALDGVAEVTLNRIKQYAMQDPRIIPFAQKMLSPVFRALEGKPLPEPARLYSDVLESLYMLDRELRVKGGIEKIASVIGEKGLDYLLASSLPAPIVAALDTISVQDATKRRIKELADTREFLEGRERQRKLYNGIGTLEEMRDGDEILDHAVRYAKNIQGLGRILAAVHLVARRSGFQYPFELEDEEKILRNLNFQLVDGSLKQFGLRADYLDHYLERAAEDQQFAAIGNILTTLSGYDHNHAQVPLMREIIEAELDHKFTQWRYSHDHAKEQLGVLGEKTGSWKENLVVQRIVGELHALQSHIDAVKNVLSRIDETYTEHYGASLSDVDVSTLEEQIKENEQQLRGQLSKKEKKDLGHGTFLLREQLAYTQFFRDINELDADNYAEILERAGVLAKKRSRNPLYDNVAWIRETLDQPEYHDARKITVEETDDLETLLRMGEVPVPHCQNWRNDSTYNQSLLSFVADANKKLYHIKNGNGKPVSMSMVRLIDWHNTPTLLVENIYANEWSEDYGIALLGSLAEKAVQIYDETDKNVRIAIPDYSGHDGHDTNIQVNSALDKFSEKYKVEIHESVLEITPPRSKNTHEYWDCGPGKVVSGMEVSIPIRYVEFGRELDE